MPRTELIRQLTELDPPTPEAWFVLLWSYFEKHGLAAAETLARARGLHPMEIPPYAMKDGIQDALSNALKEMREVQGEFRELLALRVLIALDRGLKDRRSSRFELFRLQGIDGGAYLLRRRNSYLADSLPQSATWAADQGRSLATYTRFHKAIPAEPVADYRIDCRPRTSWGDRNLHHRLEAERTRLKILLWPLHTILDYPPLTSPKLPRFISLNEVRNEDDLKTEIKTAITSAREEKATLLILPELAIPPGTDQEIRSLLASHGPLGHPILTLYGLCHRRGARESLDLNEAVLLGPDGTEIFRHLKLAPFTMVENGANVCGENIEYGTRVAVLECALGNLTPLICLDSFHTGVSEILRLTHANVFLVPSLSPVTSAHRTAAKQLQASNRASSFVCNRWLKGPSEAGTSFFQLPRKNGYTPHLPDHESDSCLRFALVWEQEGIDKTSI